MQTLSASVWRALAGAPGSALIAHRGSNRSLPAWLPLALARLVARALARRPGLVLAGDALTHALAYPLARALRARTAVIVHGLDVTYRNPLYRLLVSPALRRADTVLANSRATAAEAIRVGVPAERVHVLRVGIDAPVVGEAERRAARAALVERVGATGADILMLTLGRLVPRKGVRWFVENVLPELPPHLLYLVAGDGPEAANVRRAVRGRGLEERIRLLGPVNDEERERLLRGADLLVRPNVPVPGDMEGFGLVTVEAAVRGTLVVASALEGLAEAVVDGVTGVLVPPGDAEAWRRTLTAVASDRARLSERAAAFQAAARERYSEGAFARDLLGALALDAEGSTGA
ncbi:MAG TPA: glycosyltransferase family 4 protein [Gaiellaceae bacterium]|nr:glycosyltransferase family 4 protein [Gaiellaceae bacterium]